MNTKHIERITAHTKHGDFILDLFKGKEVETIIVLSKEQKEERKNIRIHSSCLFSETFGFLDCDCAQQLDITLDYFSKNGGYLVYLIQEGRGHGLEMKTKEVKLQQEEGLDTYEASRALGLQEDTRTYNEISDLVKFYNIKKATLYSNDSKKFKSLKDAGVGVITKNIPVKANKYNKKYLNVKKEMKSKLWNELNMSL